MLDAVVIIFWSITYVLVLIAGVLSRNTSKVSMPYTAVILNFTWELCALWYSRGFWGHILWSALDLGIVCINFRYCKSNRNRMIFLILMLIGMLFTRHVFTMQNGMLYSSFAGDFIMAVCFLTDRKKLSGKLKVSIAVTKLLGDLFAGMCYGPEGAFITILAGLVLLCNIAYLYLCMDESFAAEQEK